MPLFAAMLKGALSYLAALYIAVQTSRYALAIAAVVTLATMYVAALAVFSGFVQPLLGSLFATEYGQFLGLAFPPVAGTVVSGLVGLWVVMVGYRYLARFAGLIVPR